MESNESLAYLAERYYLTAYYLTAYGMSHPSVCLSVCNVAP